MQIPAKTSQNGIWLFSLAYIAYTALNVVSIAYISKKTHGNDCISSITMSQQQLQHCVDLSVHITLPEHGEQ